MNPRAATNDLLPFQGSPFSHLGTSAHILFQTERVGFEPTRPFGQTVFKTASLWPLRYLSKRAFQFYSTFHNLSSTFLFFSRFLYPQLFGLAAVSDLLRQPDYITTKISICQLFFTFFYSCIFYFFSAPETDLLICHPKLSYGQRSKHADLPGQ